MWLWLESNQSSAAAAKIICAAAEMIVNVTQCHKIFSGCVTVSLFSQLSLSIPPFSFSKSECYKFQKTISPMTKFIIFLHLWFRNGSKKLVHKMQPIGCILGTKGLRAPASMVYDNQDRYGNAWLVLKRQSFFCDISLPHSTNKFKRTGRIGKVRKWYPPP